MTRKTVVLDTNVLLTDVRSILAYEESDIAIPNIVLDEIDKHKHRQDTPGLNARITNKFLDELRSKGSLMSGVTLGEERGNIFVAPFDPEFLPKGMKADDSDNKIIACALNLMHRDRDVLMVSRDINMRVKCDSVGIPCEDYQPEKVISSVNQLFDGCTTVTVDNATIDDFYTGVPVLMPEETKLFPNQFVVLKNKGGKKSALCRYTTPDQPLRKITKYKNICGLSARNKEQEFAMDLLFDNNIHILSMTGPAGTGKTLLAAACGLEQVTSRPKSEGGYDKLIITRPVQPMGRDIGFLPGTIEEKMAPWIAPLRDNLEHLYGDRMALDMQIEQGVIEIEAMTFIRGRSISNAFIIVDEAQNLTAHELKTIITRVGHGTKLILTGDVQQIDNSYVDAVSNGLTHAVEKFKSYKISGHVTLYKGERSTLATLAAEIL